ncbi:hypothetical protein Q4Q94_14690 [Morganella morganii]|uniref:Uncharacterized protein n=1 Tax=Morganella morganii TaxID=582 RepID=A0AAE4JQY0_MORMO|nr:hypothetical protein [Morganella morganii]MBT0437488.1 hypothetical protein [Morganella morganii subsp. morganii]MCW9737999.1 hypothetical protein [Morganella morganii]MDS0900570.1 hypothetical protein [Morganella morganii]QSB78240.1 hypothetical protein JW294_09375 [Morganella morganii]HCR4037456.1 hypothetical protein [Morganella morganii]
MRTLTVLNKSEKTFSCVNYVRNTDVVGKTAGVHNFATLPPNSKVSFYGCVIFFLLFAGKMNAESVKVRVVSDINISGPVLPEVLSERQFHGVRNKIELLPFVPFFGEVMTSPDTESERSNSPASSPDQSNQARVSVENQNELTPEATEHFELLLWLMLFQFLVLFPLGIYFSMCISPRILAKRRRWMRFHQLKANRFHRKNPGKIYRMPRKTFCQWLWF